MRLWAAWQGFRSATLILRAATIAAHQYSCTGDPHRVASSGEAAGDYHSVAITTDGAVLSWARIGMANLVTARGPIASIPSRFPASAMATFAAGSRHNLAVLENGSVWSWGKNDYGRLGHGGRTVN